MFSLYKNLEGSDFVDASLEVRRETRLYSGWGLRFFDFDNDGDPDLVLANGHPDDMIGMFKPLVSYKQELLLFENTGKDFLNVSSTAGEVFVGEYASRGLAVGDYDNDGDGTFSCPTTVARHCCSGTRQPGETTGSACALSQPAATPRRSGRLSPGAPAARSAADPDEAGAATFVARPAGDSRARSRLRAEWIEIRWPGGRSTA